MLARSLVRTGTDMPRKCVDCFAKYCWNGTLNSTTPLTYEPQQIIVSGTSQLTPWMWQAR